MGDAIRRLNALQGGSRVFCDYHNTLYRVDNESVNTELLEALKRAQERGVRVELWTGGSFSNTMANVAYMETLGMRFDDIHCAVPKADLIIDNLAVQP